MNYLFLGGALLVASFQPAAAETFQIQIGDTVSPDTPGAGAGNIAVSTESDTYTFTATNGQIVFLEEVSVSTNFARWLYWDLKSPTAASISAQFFEGQHPGRFELPVTGTYTINVRVGTSNPNYTGDYSFRLRAVPPNEVFQIAIGDSVSPNVPGPGAGNISAPGAHDYYEFTAISNQHAFFERVSVSTNFEGWLRWDVRRPNGQSLFSSFFGSGHDGRKTFPETGTYRIRVEDGTKELSHIGDYAFRIRAIPPDQTFPIQFGQVISSNAPSEGAGNIEVAGAWDIYTFQGMSNQNLYFEEIAVSSTLGGWLYWELRSPNGQVFNDNFGGASTGRKTLPMTGLYTLRCFSQAQEISYVGSYSFRIINLDDAQVPLTIGQLVAEDVPASGAGKIELPGNQDVYTFTGVQGQKVVFEQISVASTFSGWLKWEVRSPSSNLVFGVFFQPPRKQAYVLPESGTYTMKLFAAASDPSYVGTYSLRTYCEVFAHPDKFGVAPGAPFLLPGASFECNDKWEIADVVSLELPSTNSANGGTLAVTSAGIVYAPPTGFTGIDTFSYRLKGQFGDDDVASVKAFVGPGEGYHPTVVSMERTGTNTVKVCLLGLPDGTCNVDQSTDLENWTPFTTLTNDGVGGLLFNYTTTTNELRRFYRFKRP